MELILSAVLVLGAIALVAALVLFGVSKKFAVEEDPRLGQVGELLPGANCGGCGFAGCSGMAAALVKGADAGSIDGLMCPVGGADVMGKVADLLGLAVANTEAKVAVVRCNGSCEHRPRIAEYDGLHTCAAMNSCGAGETGCGFGCLGCGDCVAACQFGAISINPETGLPEVDEEKCTGCGACAKACPRHIIELRKKGPKGRRVYVQCVNHDKGAVAKKACSVACIGCGKCQKVCKFDAITKPVVAKGDKVKVGTLIAEAGGFVSAPIYSSVSGTVFKVDTSIDATGYRKPCIIINVEGDEWEESIERSDKLETLEAHAELTPEEIVNRIKVAGVTGMGGAGFPTFIKLCPPPGAKAECVIINGVECEPYITADYRLMMEHADEILVGLNLLMKAAKVEKGYIGIEDNKPAAIKLFEEKTANDARIEIVPLAKKYPQGGEKQLVDAVIRRQVPAPPAIPVNVGAIVQNVGTAFAVYQAVMKNKPLFERYTTVTGKQVKNPGNFLVRMGTPFSQMIENCGGLPEGDNKVLAGGPMMGKAVISLDVPVTKGTNSITVLTDADAHRKKAQPCIRCAKCVDACPMGLEPYLLATLSVVKDYERLEAEEVTSCIACGSCQFTCPSHRPILDNIINGKAAVMGIIRARSAKK